MAGRKTKLTSELQEAMVQLYLRGCTDKQVGKALGISPRSIARWKANNEALSQSIKEAKDQVDEYVESTLFQRAVGFSCPVEEIFMHRDKVIRVHTVKHYPPDPLAAIFWLRNRRPGEWT